MASVAALRKTISSARSLILIVAAAFPITLRGAELKSETDTAWNSYVQAAVARLQDRVRTGNFLWTSDNAELAAKVRRGEIVIAPAPGQIPKRVPGGLIHHWIGAVFLPNVTTDQVLAVTRSYDRYKEFYWPSVADSKILTLGDQQDKFTMLLTSRTFFLTTAVEADYEATNIRLDDGRFYSITRTTRVQEIDEYGRPGEHRIPESQGNGYIWKLFSIVRSEQRDSGVYLELEAVALTREIPAPVRLFVEPIIRRVSRNSMLVSLEQVRAAICGAFGLPARDAENRADPRRGSENRVLYRVAETAR